MQFGLNAFAHVHLTSQVPSKGDSAALAGKFDTSKTSKMDDTTARM
jgi:hypothetical protein